MPILRHSRERGNPACRAATDRKRDPRLREGDGKWLGLALVMGLALAVPASAQNKKPPYWASIASGKAMMRTGPGRNYPGIWLYQRRDLPVRVLQIYPNWRKIEDPDGQQGWMLVTLLSDRRTAIVRAGSPRDIRVTPAANAPVRFRAEPGVVGHIEQCDPKWCKFSVANRNGWIAKADVYGISGEEQLD